MLTARRRQGEVSSAWWSGGERRKEVEEEADVWVPHVSELKVEKLQGYFGSYGNTFVCKWVQGHQRRIK